MLGLGSYICLTVVYTEIVFILENRVLTMLRANPSLRESSVSHCDLMWFPNHWFLSAIICYYHIFHAPRNLIHYKADSKKESTQSRWPVYLYSCQNVHYLGLSWRHVFQRSEESIRNKPLNKKK